MVPMMLLNLVLSSSIYANTVMGARAVFQRAIVSIESSTSIDLNRNIQLVWVRAALTAWTEMTKKLNLNPVSRRS
eukprot:SAG31_NODE_3011_length_4788_cov_5.207080_5_plen_75_part_00